MLKAIKGALSRGVAAVGRGFSMIGRGLMWGIEKVDYGLGFAWDYANDALEYTAEKIWESAPVRGVRYVGRSLVGDNRPALAVQQPKAPEPGSKATADQPRTAKVADFTPELEKKKAIEPEAIHDYATAVLKGDTKGMDKAILLMTAPTREWVEGLKNDRAAIEAIAASDPKGVAAHLVGTKPLPGVPAKAVPAPAGLSPDLSKIASQSRKLYRAFANDAAQEQAPKPKPRKVKEPAIEAHGPDLASRIIKDMNETRKPSEIVRQEYGPKPQPQPPQSLDEARARVAANRAATADYNERRKVGGHVPHLAMA